MFARTEDNEEPLSVSAIKQNGWHRQIFQEMLEDCNGDRVFTEKKTQAHSCIPYFPTKPVGTSRLQI